MFRNYQSVFDYLHQNCLQLTPVQITSLSLTLLKLYAKNNCLKKNKGIRLVRCFHWLIKKCDLFKLQLISVLPSLPLSLLKEGNTLVLHCCQLGLWWENINSHNFSKQQSLSAQVLSTSTCHWLFPCQTLQPTPRNLMASDPLPGPGRTTSPEDLLVLVEFRVT